MLISWSTVQARRGEAISLDLSTELIDDALSLKSYSYLRMSQLVIPHMSQNGWGRIINIAGGAGTSPSSGNIPVSLANIAILNMTRALSDAVSKDGILVNTICPGLTNTQRARDVQQASADQAGKDVEELLQELGNELPQDVSLSRRKLLMCGISGIRAVLVYIRQLYIYGRRWETGDTVCLSVIIPTLPNPVPTLLNVFAPGAQHLPENWLPTGSYQFAFGFSQNFWYWTFIDFIPVRADDRFG